MEFLVRADVKVPPDMPAERREPLERVESARGRELKADGTIVRIWKIPGRKRSVGIWEATDATELHRVLSELPMFPWVDFDVTPLARHYLEADPD